MNLSRFPTFLNVALFPFVLNLSKDASGRDVHFDKLRANSFFALGLIL